ncbi:transposable element Tcb1 transposase [Trichonephila clavipes]|nr:transposable element Tcb1 transposase [Trichonephila clavipes]
MSRRKQRSTFDQVSEFHRGRIVAYRNCGLSFKEICSRVGRNQTTVMRICDRWMQGVRQTDVVDRIHLSVPLHNEVVFTDESRICLQHHDGRIRVWRHHGERMLKSCVMHRHTSPAPGIIVWGGIGYHSRTPPVRIASTLDSQRPHLRGVGASCPSLPSGLKHSHISTG